MVISPRELTRIPVITQQRISEIRKITNTRSALEAVVDLFENYVAEEERVPVWYNKKTGKAVEYAWKPSRNRFESEIDCRYDDNNSQPGLAKNVVKEIKKRGPLLLDTHFGKYVFTYEKKDVSGTEPHSFGGTYYESWNSISVKKIAAAL